MLVDIKIIDSEVPEFISLYEMKENLISKQIQENEEKINSLKHELKRISDQLKYLKSSTNKETTIKAEKVFQSFEEKTIFKPEEFISIKNETLYPTEGTWWERIKFVLQMSDDYIPTRMILDEIFKLEPNTAKETVMRSVTGVITTKSKKGGFLDFERKDKRFVYKLKNSLK